MYPYDPSVYPDTKVPKLGTNSMLMIIQNRNLKTLRACSSSRGKFCVNIVRDLIGEEVMSQSNMSRQKKDKLDPQKIELFKKWAFEYAF